MKSNRLRWTSLITITSAAIAIAVVRTGARPAPPQETAAINYVKVNGFHSTGKPAATLTSVYAHLFGTTQAIHPNTVGFPRDRMNDEMAKRLLCIRNLGAIMLFPPDLDGRGYDRRATLYSTVQSLSDVELAVSPECIAKLELQFPDLVVIVADPPAKQLVADETGDVTN